MGAKVDSSLISRNGEYNTHTDKSHSITIKLNVSNISINSHKVSCKCSVHLVEVVI